MRRASPAACLLWLACALAQAAPPLQIPYGRLGQHPAASGPSALWQADGSPPFMVETRSDPDHGGGSVLRRELVVRLGGQAGLAAQASWDASAILSGTGPAAPSPAPAARQLYTMDEQGATIAFLWPRLGPAWREALDAPAPGEPADGLGEIRSHFLRGERTREAGQPGGVLRRRAGVLGDLVHSVPLVVGAPAAFEVAPGYAAFRMRHQGRRPAIYVGANDGMLHAFAADGGAELFAYLPAALAQATPLLASAAWVPRAYVDASAGHGDARLGGRWRSVLGCGMGMGARGLFALDITAPARFGDGMGALWEFTERDDPAVGHIRAPPLVARVGKLPVLVASSGINPLAGEGALFMLSLAKRAGQAWQEGRNYLRIDTPAGEPGLPNALGPPALALRGDGSASHAYAGDLQGRLWRFDLSARSVHLLFTARDGAGTAQPITHAPSLVFAPGGGHLVLFGTGKLLEQSDLLPPSYVPHTLYAIHDRPGHAAVTSRKQLAGRRLSGQGKFTVKGAPPDYFAADPKRGWYLDFPDSRSHGERAAASPTSVDGAILFHTVLFDPVTAAASTRMYVIDALTGSALDAAGLTGPDASTGELLLPGAMPPPFLSASAPAGAARSATGAVTALRSLTLLHPGGSTRLQLRFTAARLGWREVANWPELHAKTRGTP